MTLLRHDAAKAATSVPLLCHASVHLGRVAGRLLCQDETAFLGTADSAWKSRKKKGITLANTGDP